MAIRFTEYLQHEKEDIALYIVQEDIDVDKVGFKIFIKGGGNIVFALYKEVNQPWQLIPQNVPIIVQDIKAQLIALLERQLTTGKKNNHLVRRLK